MFFFFFQAEDGIRDYKVTGVSDVCSSDLTVYYVVGTKDELEQKGIITEEGGARFLFVLWKSGKTLVPSRNLDPGVFTVADRRHFTELPLPESDKEYRIEIGRASCRERV